MTPEHMKRVMALKWTELVDKALDDHILTSLVRFALWAFCPQCHTFDVGNR